jgi:hypothetical protein
MPFDPVGANPPANNTMTKWVALVLLVAEHKGYNLHLSRPAILKCVAVLRSCS